MMDYDKKLVRLEKQCFPKKKRGFFETGKFVEKSIHELYEFYQKMGYQIRCVVGMREASAMFYKIVPEFPVPLTPFDKEDTIDWQSYTKADAVLVLGTFNSSRTVESRFWNQNLNCMILNIYDYFYLRGYELYTDFWEYCVHRGNQKQTMSKRKDAYLRHCYYQYGIWHKILERFSIADVLVVNPIMSRIYCMRKAYEARPGSRKLQVMYLQRFLYECIKGRDYLTTKKYIQEYVKNHYEHAERYQEFLIQWEEILEKIRDKISKRTEDDIVLNWLDAMSKNRMKDMPYVKRLAEENTQLENAYTVMPLTTACMKSIFTGIAVMEGKLYRYKRIIGSLFKFKDTIKRQKYRFYYIGPRHLKKKLFLKQDCAPVKIQEDDIGFTYYYWTMMCLLASSKKKLFLLVHELWTTHPSYFSPDLSCFEVNAYKAEAEQKSLACRYADRQLEWWDGFLNEKICRIYMGDHGDPAQKPYYSYISERTHIMFAIKNAKRKLTQTNRFFSLKNMERLLTYIMEWEECTEESLYSDAVCIEFFDYYSRKYVDAMMRDREKYPDYRNWAQMRAIRTEQDMLVRYANGNDWYFLLPDEETNHIADSNCQERIQELKERLGEGFIDIWKDDFFKESRRLYQGTLDTKEKK